MPVARAIRLDPAPPPLAPALRMLECGWERTQAGQVFPQRRFAVAAIIASECGRAAAVVNGRRVEHRPGTVLAIAPGFELIEEGDAVSPWEARWILLDGPWARELGAALVDLPGRLLVVPRAPRTWLRLMAEVLDILQHPGRGREWLALARLGELLAAIQREAGRHDRPEAPLAERLRTLIDEAPERGWSLDEVALELGLSRSVLAHRFAAETGGPPARYLRRRRCEHARLLLERGFAVREVAERLGFPDQFQFSRCYRTVMGAPPSAARSGLGLRG